jgi:Zn-dependent protease
MSELAQVRILVAVAWFFSVYVHEIGHSTVAHWGGDDEIGRRGGYSPLRIWMTNPILSLVLPMLSLVLVGLPLPGAAVQIRADRLRSRGWRAATFLGGPASTIVVTLALVCVYLLVPPGPVRLAIAFVAWANVMATMINLAPIPPLDGFGVVSSWFSAEAMKNVPRLVPYVMIAAVLMLLRYEKVSHFLRLASGRAAIVLGIEAHDLESAWRLLFPG